MRTEDKYVLSGRAFLRRLQETSSLWSLTPQAVELVTQMLLGWVWQQCLILLPPPTPSAALLPRPPIFTLPLVLFSFPRLPCLLSL